MINYNKENDLSDFSLIDFLKNNIFQILLLTLTFVIIYIVDRITFFNNMFIHIQQQKMLKEYNKKIKK
jgi:hypothetical protein